MPRYNVLGSRFSRHAIGWNWKLKERVFNSVLGRASALLVSPGGLGSSIPHPSVFTSDLTGILLSHAHALPLESTLGLSLFSAPADTMLASWSLRPSAHSMQT